jgi:hypothetical protein
MIDLQNLLDADILLPVNLEDLDDIEPKLETKVPNIAFAVQKDGIVSRPITILPNIDFELFRYRVADEFGEAASTQDLVWKTNRMTKSANWGTLKDADNFKRIIDQAKATLHAENERRELIKAKNDADAAKAKKQGKPHVPKPVPPIEEFVILIRDCNQEQKAKALAVKKVTLLYYA